MSDIGQILLDRIKALEIKVRNNSIEAFSLLTQGIRRKTLATLGSAGDAGRLFFVTDVGVIYVDNGSAWVAVNAQGVPTYTVAALPIPPIVPATYTGLAFASNGRKPPEGPGAGTGVLCYYNSATSQWFRTADDTQVQA